MHVRWQHPCRCRGNRLRADAAAGGQKPANASVLTRRAQTQKPSSIRPQQQQQARGRQPFWNVLPHLDGLTVLGTWASHAAAGSSAASTSSPASRMDEFLPSKQLQRKERLTTLLELRRTYQNILHAKSCLEYPSPVYQSAEAEAAPTEEGAAVEDDKEQEMIEQEQRNKALEIVAEMQLTSELLKASLRSLPQGFGWVFGSGPQSDWGSREEEHIREVARDYAVRLRERFVKELPLLPFKGEGQAQALIDARNARYIRRPAQGQSPDSSSSLDPEAPSPIGRLEQAEKVAEQFVQRRLKPVLRRAQEAQLGDLLRDTGSYLKGLWVRLNGGGRSGRRVGLEELQLPVPQPGVKESELAIGQLNLELESLEKQLQEASKARENKLRKAGPPGRVQMAIQLKGLDADVLELSRLLAVRTLQLELEYVFRSLEDEALDASGYDEMDAVLVDRDSGTSEELALLVADFVLLDEQLTALSQALSGSSTDKAGGREGSILGIVGEDVLEKLAVEIPDFRLRTGVMDQTVFGGSGFSLTRLQLQAGESLDKVREGVDFMVRGVRMLGSDVGNAGRLFTRAALGGTLKPREVSALRRTARDLLTFIPFTIILIIPITPLGHVLVFSLIQTYFPSFFPSCFTKRRQEIMVKYEELQRQLMDAQNQAEQAEEEAELARAAAAVARLTAPDDETMQTGSSSDEAEQQRWGSSMGDVAAPAVPGVADKEGQQGVTAESSRAAGLPGPGAAGVRPVMGLGGGGRQQPPPHVDKVRALEQELSQVLESVNMGDSMGEDDGLPGNLPMQGNGMKQQQHF